MLESFIGTCVRTSGLHSPT